MASQFVKRQMTYYDGALLIDYTKDNTISHYRIAGERFKHNNELLKIISEHKGMCLENQHYGTFTHCNFDCYNCPKSAYHLLQVKERYFNQRCENACARIPKKDDVWELSMVMEDEFPYRYLDFFFTALKDMSSIGLSIMDLCISALDHIDSDIYNKTRFCYIKIKRFDEEAALDVSVIANVHIKNHYNG